MKVKIIVIALVLSIGGYIYAQSTSDLRKAFLAHQGQESEEIKSYYPQVGGENFVLSERWRNYQKDAKSCPAIAEVTSVVISKTTDTGSWVIQMSGPSAHTKQDGFQADVCSLWIRGGVAGADLQVGDMTPY